MSDFEHISDELLACYLDGNCSEAEARQIENVISTSEDLHTLLLSQSVMNRVEAEMNALPGFEKGKEVRFEPYTNLRATGFLGNQDITPLFSEEEPSIDNDKES